MPGTHLLEGEFLVVGLDASDIVWRGGVQGLHEQVQGGAELGRQKPAPGYSFIFNILWMYDTRKGTPTTVVVTVIVLTISANLEGQEEI